MPKLYTLRGLYPYIDTSNLPACTQIITEIDKAIENLEIKMCKGDMLSICPTCNWHGNEGLYIWDAKTIPLLYDKYISRNGDIPSQFTLDCNLHPNTYKNILKHSYNFWPTLEQRQEIVNNLRYGNLYTKNNSFYSYFMHSDKKIPFVLNANCINIRASIQDYTKMINKDFVIDSDFENKFLIKGDIYLDGDLSTQEDFPYDNCDQSTETEITDILFEPISIESIEELNANDVSFGIDSFLNFDSFDNSCILDNKDAIGVKIQVDTEILTLINEKYLFYKSDSNDCYKDIIIPLNLDAIIQQIMNLNLPFSNYEIENLKINQEFTASFTPIIKTYDYMDDWGGGPTVVYYGDYKMFDSYYSKLFGGNYI